MAENLGKVTLRLQLEVPLRKPWDEQYVFDRLLSLVRWLQETVSGQFGVKLDFDLTQEWAGGNVRRRERPDPAPGPESDPEGP